jgi:hypothetical protein
MSTILVATLVVWTIFGFFVLFNSVDELTYSKTNLFKLALALGPVLLVAGVVVGGFLAVTEKMVACLKK